MAVVSNCVEKNAENFSRLSRVHERYRQTTDRRSDGRWHIANVNVSSRSLMSSIWQIYVQGARSRLSLSARRDHDPALHHGVKHNDFCCFKGVTYVALTLCFKLISFLHWLYVTVDIVCIEEQDSSKTVEQSADAAKLSCTTSPALTVWFQFCVIFAIKSEVAFGDGWSFIFPFQRM